ncbi:MAG: translation initiation factor IF-6 [Candidatus Nanohaloarchaea archaeon]
MNVERYNYRGDINIGLYATLTDSYAAVPIDFKAETEVEQVETRIAGTRLVGLFTAGNSNCLLVPDSAKERELEKLGDAGVEYHIIEARENALGNLILANENGAIVSEKLSGKREEISEALEVPVKIASVAGITNPGACGFANSSGVLLHRDAAGEEAETIRNALDVEKADIGTVNMGSPYIGTGIVGNNSTILMGGDTTGPELGRIDRVLVDH